MISHYPLGDSITDAYCGVGRERAGALLEPLCPIAPAAVPRAPQVRALGRTAAADDAELRAYERTNPIVLRGTDTQWSADAMDADIAGRR